MGRCALMVLLLVVVALVVAGVVEGYPAEDLVEKLPGQPEVPFRQYAGHVVVDANAGKSFFYYFVEAYSDARNKPLTLWSNGGPGCSSLGGGAFTELGPFYPTGNGRGLRINNYSWNKVSNLLFVEYPAGVGFSYSNTTSDYTTGDERTANDMREFMLRWFDKFPDFKSRDFFLTGESYAGHYIPQLTVALLNYNKQSTGFQFRIKGVAIGNPLINMGKDSLSGFQFLWSHGLMSDETNLIIKENCNFGTYDYGPGNNQTYFCQDALSQTRDAVGITDRYGVTLDNCYPEIAQQGLQLREVVTRMSYDIDVCMDEEASFYLNIPEVQHALHANKIDDTPVNWRLCTTGGTGLNYTLSDHEIDTSPLLKEIIGQGIPLLVYSGDQDSIIPLLGTRRIVREIAEDLKLGTTSSYRAWFDKNQVGGWAIEYGNVLTFATVRGAPHMVPRGQPLRSLILFNAFITRRRLPTKLIGEIDQ